MGEERLKDDEINLLDYLVVILKRKLFILKMTAVIVVLVTIIVFLVPNKYESTAQFLPPTQSSSSLASAMLTQLGISSLAGGILGTGTPGDLYVGLLQSRTVLDKIIDKYDCMRRYATGIYWILPFYREDCRKKLTDDIMTAQVDDKSGIVSVTIDEEDPKISADMANSFVQEMRDLSKLMGNKGATERRRFYEAQINKAKADLTGSEEDMRSFEEKTGALQPDAQAQAVITNDAALRAQIAAKQVEIQVLKTYTTPNNPDLQKAVDTLKGMKTELARLEVKSGNGHDPLMPTGRMPSVGLEYARKLRDVKFNEALYELLVKLLESARLDEEGDSSIIQVVDKAIYATRKAKPKRGLIIALSVFAGFFLSVITAFVLEFKEKAEAEPGNKDRISLLRTHWRWKRKKGKEENRVDKK